MSWLHDTFTEASNTPLTSHTSESGHTWVFAAGSNASPGIYPGLGGSVVGSGSTSTQIYRTSAVAASADGSMRALCNYQGTFSSIGICRRLTAGGDAGYLAAYLPSTSKWYIFRLGAALATTQLAVSASTYAYAANDTPDITFDVQGTGATVTLSLTVNGTVVCSGTDTSGSRVTANGYDGLWFNTPSAVATGMFFGEVWGDAAAAASYTISQPVDGRIYQLSAGASGNSSISLSGTYTGTAPNQWRVVLDGTSTPVSGLDWQAFSSAPSGGNFAQTITVPKQSGWLNVQVRDSASGISQSSGKVGTGVLVMVDGQSPAWLFFSSTAYAGDNSLTPNALVRVTGKQAGGGVWTAPSAASMNAAIACGNALVSACGCPVGLIDGSWDASGLTIAGGSGASGPNGQWISGGAAGNAYTSSAAALTAAGGKAAATIWAQGQGDAGASVSQASYYTAFGQMAALRRSAVADSAHPYVIVTHPRHGSLTDTQVENIRKAHVQACGDANAWRVDSADLPLHTDNVHFSAAGQTFLGQRCAQAVLAALGLATSYRGPRIANAVQISSTVYDLNLTLSAWASDISPSTGITGIRALVSGSPVSVASVVRQSATKIRVTLSATPASMPAFDSLYGAMPTVTQVARDNSSLTLPLEYTPAITSLPQVVNVSVAVTDTGDDAFAATGVVTPHPIAIRVAAAESGDDVLSMAATIVPPPVSITVTVVESGDDVFAATAQQLTGADLAEPLTLAEAKLAARIDATITAFDNDVSRGITAARLMAEQITGRDFVRKTRRVTLKEWPAATDVLHVYEPVDVAISYWDGTAWQALDANAYAYWAEDAGTCIAPAIAPAIGASWPTLGQVAGGARVRIDITAGPADPRAATPADVKLYIAAMVSHWHDNPGAMVAGNASPNPFIERLLDAACIYA